jgi:GNAT superfamily N-acetyltransferase
MLQHFFDTNPAYFLAVNGEPAGPAEAREVLADRPPPGWPYTHRWLLGWLDADDAVAAMADLATDLLAPGVWHIGLFIVATARHGSGDAQALYGSLEDWARTSGAAWMRLGVVQGNTRAERFWASCGYQQVRIREGLAMGRCVHIVRVMCKRLAGGGLADYLARVPRDRPDVAPPSTA